MTSGALGSVVKWRGHRFIALAVRLYLGWLFLSACWHKIAHPAGFALDVATYQLLPLGAVNVFAIILPWLELLVGLLLIIGCRVRAAALLVVLMMLSFIVALLWALHLGLDMSCGCFASQAASTDDSISGRALIRDMAWLLLGAYVFGCDRNSIGILHVLPRGAK
jgi:putative oxidoreductase